LINAGGNVKSQQYSGNGKPFIYVMCAPQDRRDAEAVCAAMREKGYALWLGERFDKRRINKAALVLFVLSKAALDSETINRAINHVVLTDRPMLAVYLEPAELTPAQKLLLITQQGIMRYDCENDAGFHEKLFGSPALQNLRVTPAQKHAANLTTSGIALSVLAAAALAVILTLGLNATIPNDSLLAEMGYSGRKAEIRQVYIYGQETRAERGDNTFCSTVYDWQKNAWQEEVFFNDANEECDAGDIDDVSDFGQLKNLEELSVAGNRITDISPLFGLEKLRFLDLAGNPVSDLDGIESLGALTQLNITGTQVSSVLPLDGCESLETVYVDSAQYEAFSNDGAAHAFDMTLIGPLEDLLHLDTYIVGGAEEPDGQNRAYAVFLRTLSWEIYDEYTYEVYKNGEQVKIDTVEYTTIFPGRANDETDLLLNREDFGSYDTTAEYRLVVRYRGASATYVIGHQDDKVRENPMCPELIEYSGF